ncbi:hypothetical protein L218DRAFT_955340 [Marasmius fiardii PR-910]|nr:hypothetical protein L218DRAFT_955340 [Marasmius fiardii PR-910]
MTCSYSKNDDPTFISISKFLLIFLDSIWIVTRVPRYPRYSFADVNRYANPREPHTRSRSSLV